MAKLQFPGVGAPYRAVISEFRTQLQIIASYVRKSPGAIPQINEQLAVLAAVTGFETEPDPLPSNQAVVTDGTEYVDGTYTVTVNVDEGVVTVSVVDGGA